MRPGLAVEDRIQNKNDYQTVHFQAVRVGGLTPALVQITEASNNHHAAGQVPGRATNSLQYEQISTITVKTQIIITN